MIQLTPQMRVFVALRPADFRKGIDGLVRVCRELGAEDPFSGAVFVFRNRRGTAVKVLAYDGQGFWLCQKRLSSGRFRYWPSGPADARQQQLLAHEVQVLLAAGDPVGTRAAPQWRPIAPVAASASP